MNKIITAIFKVESEGFQALTELKKAPETDTYTVSQAALIRKENNRINIAISSPVPRQQPTDRPGPTGAQAPQPHLSANGAQGLRRP